MTPRVFFRLTGRFAGYQRQTSFLVRPLSAEGDRLVFRRVTKDGWDDCGPQAGVEQIRLVVVSRQDVETGAVAMAEYEMDLMYGTLVPKGSAKMPVEDSGAGDGPQAAGPGR